MNKPQIDILEWLGYKWQPAEIQHTQICEIRKYFKLYDDCMAYCKESGGLFPVPSKGGTIVEKGLNWDLCKEILDKLQERYTIKYDPRSMEYTFEIGKPIIVTRAPKLQDAIISSAYKYINQA